MAEEWHYTSAGKPMEPVGTVELQNLARAGLLKPTDLVWREGMPEWSLASKTTGLFDRGPTAAVSPEGALSEYQTNAGKRDRRPDSARRLYDREDSVNDQPRRQPIRKEGLSTGAVVGILVGAGVLMLAVVVGVILLMSSSGRQPRFVANRNFPAPNPNNRRVFPPQAFPPIDMGDQPRPENPLPLGDPRAVPAGGLMISDILNNTDARDPVFVHVPCKVYAVQLKADRSYTIELISQDFDAYLRVENEQFQSLAEDDDSGGNLDSRLVFVPPQTGTYRVVAISLHGDPGRFSLRIRPNR